MNQKIKVSILLPVYNGEKYLENSINSILNQTFKDFEFLIIDDGSTDNSVELIKKFNDHRIVFVKNNKNIGLIKTLNKGLDLAQGEYVARMDQDDISLQKRLSMQVAFMDKNSDCGVCGSWIKTFGDVKSQIIKYETDPDAIRAQLLFLNPLAHPTTILRKEVFNKFNLRYDDFYKNAEDYELWTRVINFSKICNIPEVLLNYRVSQGQITQKYQDAQNKMVMLIRKKTLSALKTNFNDNDVFIHQNLGTYNSPPTEEFIDKVINWLIKIKNINLEKNIYLDKNLLKIIGTVYYNLLIKNINLGAIIIKKLFFSELSKNIKLKYKIIFMAQYIKNQIIKNLKKEDIAVNTNCAEFEVNNWTISCFVIKKLIPVVKFRPFPLSELCLLSSTLCFFKPTHIFEWGTHIGKSARIFYETAKYFNIPVEIHSIDLPDNISHVEHPGCQRGKLVKGLRNVILHQGDGLNKSLEIIKNIASGCRPLFYIDGDHSYESVKRELTGIMVSVPNAIILLHDTFYQSAESNYNIGPFKAVNEALNFPNNQYKKIQLNTGLPGMTLLYK